MAAHGDKAARRRNKERERKAAAALGYPSARSYAHREGTRLGVVIGPTRLVGKEGAEEHFTLDLVDLDRGGPTERIRLDFFAHGFSFEPQAPHRAVLFEKRGSGGAHVDLSRLEVLRSITPMDGHHFYGHGTFSTTGEVLFVVESHLEAGVGAISVRDAATFAVLDTFPTYGSRPHDCVLVDHGNTLVITNGGGPIGGKDLPCVTFVHVPSRKLLERHEVSNPRLNTGHVALASGRDFAVVSAPREGLVEERSLGGVSLRTRRGGWRYLQQPNEVTDRLLGETLSVAIHGDTVAATTPLAGLLTFWSLSAGRLMRAVPLSNVRGVTVTLDGTEFVVSHGAEATLGRFSCQTLERVEHDGGRARCSGSHLYTWAYPAGA